jgi:hypothetical protein
LAAGLLGYRRGHKNTPSLAGLPGFDGADQNSADSIVADLTGKGPFGKTGGLFGQLPGHSGDSTGGWPGALSDLLGNGPGRFGPNGFENGTPSSPYAPTGYLGPQGARGDYGDLMIWTGKAMQGVGGMLGGAALGALLTGAGTPATVPLGIDGLVLLGLGAALEVHGTNANAREQAEQVITGGSSSTITIPPVVIGPDDPPPPPPPDDDPHEGDLYPDPEDSGGGTPNTIWGRHGRGRNAQYHLGGEFRGQRSEDAACRDLRYGYVGRLGPARPVRADRSRHDHLLTREKDLIALLSAF